MNVEQLQLASRQKRYVLRFFMPATTFNHHGGKNLLIFNVWIDLFVPYQVASQGLRNISDVSNLNFT